MKKNIIANYIGRFWSFFSAFLFTPLYIHYLGIEAYSIVSFSLVITGLMSVLDAGLTATLSREFALKSNTKFDRERTLSTLEIFYVAIALFIIIIMIFFSNQIASNWINLEHIKVSEFSSYLRLIGIGIAFQFLGNFYMGGLMGIEQQVKGNLYQVVWGVFRNAFVIIPIIYNPSLEIFFAWQTFTTIIYAFYLRRSLIKELDVKINLIRKPIVDMKILRRTWRFASGMLLISIVASLNTQMDKLAISKLLPINVLGYYTLAISISQAIVLLINPISVAIIPRFTSLYSGSQTQELQLLFRKTSLFISIVIFSFGFNIIFYAKELLFVWTNDLYLADCSCGFIPFLTGGMMMLGFQILPYSIAIANGYTRLNNLLGLGSLILTLPGYWLMTLRYGALGAAITWAVVQSLITIIYVIAIHRRFLSMINLTHYIINNFIKTAFIALLVVFIFSRVSYFETNRFLEFVWIGLSTVFTGVAIVFYFVKKEDVYIYYSSIRKFIRK